MGFTQATVGGKVTAAMYNEHAGGVRSYLVASVAARDALTGMVAGDQCYVTAVTTAYQYSGSAWVNAAAGLVPVVPTSVSGTGVTVSGVGLVTFAGSSAVNINGCFTSQYSNYRIVVDVPTTSTALNITMRLRASSVDDSASVYDSQNLSADVAAVAATATTAAAQWALSAGARTQHTATIETFGPQLTARTAYKLEMWSNNASNANSFLITRGGFHRTAGAYDGFSLTASTGNMTGTLKVYGYN